MLFAAGPTVEDCEACGQPSREGWIVEDDGVRRPMVTQGAGEESIDFLLYAGGSVFGPKDVQRGAQTVDYCMRFGEKTIIAQPCAFDIPRRAFGIENVS